jgi:hypothetical protein
MRVVTVLAGLYHLFATVDHALEHGGSVIMAKTFSRGAGIV